MPEEQSARRPLTGILTIEWVDGADPDDASAPPNFGWFNCSSEPPLDHRRLALLLRALADTADEMSAEREERIGDDDD